MLCGELADAQDIDQLLGKAWAGTWGWGPHCGNLHLGRGLLRDLAHEVEQAVVGMEGNVVPWRHALSCMVQDVRGCAWLSVLSVRLQCAEALAK